MRKTIIVLSVLLILLVAIFFSWWFGVSYRIRNGFHSLAGSPSMTFSRTLCTEGGGTAICNIQDTKAPVKTSWTADGTLEARSVALIPCASFNSVIGTFTLRGNSLVLQYKEHMINPMFCAFPQELRFTFRNLPKKEYTATMQRL